MLSSKSDGALLGSQPKRRLGFDKNGHSICTGRPRFGNWYKCGCGMDGHWTQVMKCQGLIDAHSGGIGMLGANLPANMNGVQMMSSH